MRKPAHKFLLNWSRRLQRIHDAWSLPWQSGARNFYNDLKRHAAIDDVPSEDDPASGSTRMSTADAQAILQNHLIRTSRLPRPSALFQRGLRRYVGARKAAPHIALQMMRRFETSHQIHEPARIAATKIIQHAPEADRVSSAAPAHIILNSHQWRDHR